MPNGVSCAYFAAKNLKVGIKEKNVFRDGIAGIQAARTADAAASTMADSGIALADTATFTTSKTILSKVAGFAKKLLYPLIICSGIYKTTKAKDKVKTGVSQASAISLMFGMEQLAEKTFLKKLDSRFAHSDNKKVKIGWYILKGLTYAACSMTGYEAGNKIGGKIVDKIRERKNAKKNNNADKPQETVSKEDIAKIIFNDIDNFRKPLKENR